MSSAVSGAYFPGRELTLRPHAESLPFLEDRLVEASTSRRTDSSGRDRYAGRGERLAAAARLRVTPGIAVCRSSST